MMQVPNSWEGLRGTLGVQLAHLRAHVAAMGVLIPGLTHGQKARSARPEDGVSADLIKRIVARKHGKWAEPARVIADDMGITPWRVEYFRKREREGMGVCAS